MTPNSGIRQIQPPLARIVRGCPAARAAALIGDAWTQLILREMFAGACRFSDFLTRLGISRTVLAERLRRLERNGLIEGETARPGGARYVLTEMGRDTIGIVLIQDAWEAAYGSARAGAQVVTYRHDGGDAPVEPLVVDAATAIPLEARRLNFVPGTLDEPAEPARTGRHKLIGDASFPAAMPGSISLLGDYWSWMILICAFFHARRFDEFSQALGIASNVLTDRLQRLVAADLLVRERYQRTPPRHEYRLAVAGRAMHALFCALYGWGERWLCSADAPPMMLVDIITGQRVMPMVSDAATGARIDSRQLIPVRVDAAA